jgi:hypothetical protein
MMPVQAPEPIAERQSARGEGYHWTAMEVPGRRLGGQACCRHRFPLRRGRRAWAGCPGAGLGQRSGRREVRLK